jgi:hypothetical protein
MKCKNEFEIRSGREPRPYKGAIGLISWASRDEDKHLVGKPATCTRADGMGSDWTVITTGDEVRTGGGEWNARVGVTLLDPGQQVVLTVGFRD